MAKHVDHSVLADMDKYLLADVERRMLGLCIVTENPASQIIAAIRYHLAAGGLRLRANLALDSSLRLGLGPSDAAALAATCELLHNASLVQDDLLDDEPLRRNQPSVWIAFDRTAAICAGDLMLASAYISLTEITRGNLLPQLMRHTHARASEVILGQSEEKAAEDAPPATFAAYERIAVAKSAALLALPIELPLIAANMIAAEELASLNTARNAAESFAIAYQIADDLVDFTQDALNGSLNAVSVLIRSGLAYEDARAQAYGRAIELLECSIEDAKRLPNNCAAVMLDHASKAIAKLVGDHELCHAR